MSYSCSAVRVASKYGTIVSFVRETLDGGGLGIRGVEKRGEGPLYAIAQAEAAMGQCRVRTIERIKDRDGARTQNNMPVRFSQIHLLDRSLLIYGLDNLTTAVSA